MKNISIIGSTGSIGTQALDVVREGDFAVCALAAGRNAALLEQQARAVRPQYAVLADEKEAKKLKTALADTSVRVMGGEDAVCAAAALEQADLILNAAVGIAGLRPTLAAIETGKTLALANKESLVCGGELVMARAKARETEILPVDSEHSAIFQCLQDAHSAKTLEKILLTASGGPFFGKTRQELEHVTKEAALRHPNWSMGAKITIDSASLMNKGLELIEAVWLFGLPAEKVQVVVQRQSIIHSMVQFSDHSILAQLGVPDMRIPIQYALTWPDRAPCPAPELDFTQLKSITFDTADEETFRCLAACKKAIGKGGLAPCAANGANEEAVKLFLQDKIPFLKIGELVEAVVDSEPFGQPYTLSDVYECDAMARSYVNAHV